MKISIAIITHCSRHHLPFCLPPLLESKLRILVVNSSSDDDTVKLAKEMGAETLLVPRESFNHGATRELARKFLGGDIIVMMTPDAYAENSSFLEHLIKPIQQGQAAVSYARQIPHDKADFFESFPRDFNYPQKSELRSLKDTPQLGAYTFFCSNSCAAWSQKALDAIGGFKPVLMGEDTLATCELLHKGEKIAYVSEALVKHSHHYSLLQEFQRHFDIGLSRKEIENYILSFGDDTQRGKQYVKAMFTELCKKYPQHLPYALLHVTSKWLGYKMGRKLHDAPQTIKQLLSMQDFYWRNL